MHAWVDGEHRAVVEVRPGVWPLIPGKGRREDQGDQPQKGGGYCAAMALNLGHFAASNSLFFVSISSLSFSTWRVHSALTPLEIAVINGSTAPLAISSHTPLVFGGRS
jgi:hypothetical protein